MSPYLTPEAEASKQKRASLRYDLFAVIVHIGRQLLPTDIWIVLTITHSYPKNQNITLRFHPCMLRNEYELYISKICARLNPGQMDNGHYVCYVRKHNSWFKIDDTCVSAATEEEILNSYA